ncbi:hypothetical protein PG993_004175 [Apiospora rasikravindrae]|uniref:AA1-like domain-containing protein n=1 Tax=Apiospora rasikravindrae TaxID=990691 RepID=A0ABR1TDS6_9PEZI
MQSWFVLATACTAWALPSPGAAIPQDARPAILLQPPAADGADVTYAVPECPPKQQDPTAAVATANFVVREFAYLKYVVAPGQIDALPNTTQVAFALDNSAAAVTTACSFNRGAYDDGEAWYPCGDRTITSEVAATPGDGPQRKQSQYTVKTSARFEWDRWVLAVRQSWVCGGSMSPVSAQAVTVVEPACQTSDTGSYTIQQCTAPDATIGADFD